MAKVKTAQIMHIVDFGKEYRVIKRLGCTEEFPYRIYHCYYDYDGKHTCPTYHKKQVAQCELLGDVFKWFYFNV